MRLWAGFRAAWAARMHHTATELRETVWAEHSAWIPLLMASCTHAEWVGDLLPLRPDAVDHIPELDYCPLCAARDCVPGLAGVRLRLLWSLADLYDALAFNRKEH